MFDQVDIVHGSDISESLKEYEKTKLSSRPLVLDEITLDMKIPMQVQRFWSSVSNKEKLQILKRDFFVE